jgi:hypothetical protein
MVVYNGINADREKYHNLRILTSHADGDANLSFRRVGVQSDRSVFIYRL